MAKQDNDWMAALAALKGSMPADSTPEAEEPAAEAVEAPGQTGRLDVVLDRKGRKGKSATIIEGFTLPDEEVEQICSALKRQLGTGGSWREGEILIQGDRRDDVLRFLTARGFKARII